MFVINEQVIKEPQLYFEKELSYFNIKLSLYINTTEMKKSKFNTLIITKIIFRINFLVNAHNNNSKLLSNYKEKDENLSGYIIIENHNVFYHSIIIANII